MKKLCLIISVLITSYSFSQNAHNANWIFGKDGASIKFSPVGPTALNNITTNPLFGVNPPTLNIVEGSAVVSSSQAQVIFYTDGYRVFDANNNVTPNGEDLKGNISSSQNVIIVPRPNQDIKGYFIATIDGYSGNQSGMYWSEFDTTLNSYMGDVVEATKNTPFMYDGYPIDYITSEKITSTNHANGLDYWIVVQYDEYLILSYLVSNSGISQNPIVSTFNAGSDDIGMIKISPDGSHIVLTKDSNGIHLGNFNNITGQVTFTNSISSIFNNNDRFYGVEFSPNGENIFFQMHNYNGGLNNINRLYSVEIDNFNSSAINLIQNFGTTQFVGLQRAIDGRIYVNRGSGSNNRISVINDPNNISNPQFVFDDINLNFGTRNPRVSFPQLVNLQPFNNTCQPLTLITESNTGAFTYMDYRSITTTDNYNVNSTSQDITMMASNFILLTPNAHIKSGSNYLASIQACGVVVDDKNNVSSKINSGIKKSSDISIYPNPSSYSITVSYKQIIKNISILSIDGKLVLNKEFNNESIYEIDISLLENGIYLVSAQTSKGKVITKKLIKK